MNTPAPKPDLFLPLAKAASAFACAVMAGFLYSVKRVNPSLEVEWGVGTLLMAFLAGALVWTMWNLVSESKKGGQKMGRPWVSLVVLGSVLFLGMFSAFLYAIKDVRRAAMLEVLQGTGLAIAVIAGVGVVLTRLARWLNRNEPPTGSTGDDPGGSGS